MNEKEKKVGETPEQVNKPAKKGNKKAWMQKIHGKNFKYGSMSTIITVVVIALTILVNVGAEALVNRFPSLKLDMSVGNRMSLSKDLTEIIDEVEHETEIIFCSPKEEFERGYNSTLMQYVGADAMTEGTRITSLAEKAAERNPNITVRYLDLDENPAFQNEFANESLSGQNVIIRTQYRYRKLGLNDMYLQTQDYSTGGYKYSSNVEYVLANALVATNLDDVPKVYFSTGHGESEAEYLEKVLTQNNFEAGSINLLTATEIDKNIDVIVISSPQSDFTVAQIEIMEEFLLNEGNYGKTVLFLMEPKREATPNLYAFFADWGLKVGAPGEVVLESNSSNYVQYPDTPLLNISSAEDSCLMDYADATVLGIDLVPLKVLFDYNNGVTTHVLLSTSDTAYIVPNGENTLSYSPSDEDYGKNAVLAYGEKFVSKNNDVLYSRVAICSSRHTLDGYVSTLSGNKNITTQFFKYITDTVGNENAVYIDAIDFSATDLTLSQSFVNTVGLGVFTIGVPLVVLIIGLVIWLRRRHL